MPVELTFGRKRGTCKVCGVEFTGPPNQKFCKEHSLHSINQKRKPRGTKKKRKHVSYE